MSHEALSGWEGKPWRLSSRKKKNSNNGTPAAEPLSEEAVLISQGSPKPFQRPSHHLEGDRSQGGELHPPSSTFSTGRGPSAGPPVDGWKASLWRLLQQEGRPDYDDDGIVIFVTSYYINHHFHRREDAPRPLRLDSDPQDWENGIKLTWEDLIQPTLPIDVVLVNPQPPFHRFPGTAATVIVHQQWTTEVRVCLTNSGLSP